jgi:hypothetical protein
LVFTASLGRLSCKPITFFCAINGLVCNNLDWLINPAIRAVNQVGDAQVLDWHGLLVTVNDHFLEAIIESFQRPQMPLHNVEVIARDINGKKI